MREIKFRAWDKKRNEMSKCNDAWFLDDAQLNSLFENNDYVFMQYTGLKDKNGKEIYEGDIVIANYISAETYEEKKSRPMKIVWGSCSYGLEYSGGLSAPSINDWNSFEIIGNIYENSELLDNKIAE